MTKAERHRVYLVSDLSDDAVRQMRMIPATGLSDALQQTGNRHGFIMPRGAAVLPRLETLS